MRMSMVVLALVLAPVLASGDSVEGTVVNNGPLPGTTVTLGTGSGARTTVCDSEGRYSFRAVPAGAYDLEARLEGFDTITRRVDVEGDTLVPPIELHVSQPSGPFTVSCSGWWTCGETAPLTIWDRPSCTDQQLHDSLIENMERGDRSALSLLRKRYETADTYQERHRLAAALLGRVPDDRSMWNELAENAEICVRFPSTAEGDFSPEFEQYCLERNVDPADLWSMSSNALGLASGDPRSRPLLHEALELTDANLIGIAIAGLATQRDTSALPGIRKAFERLAAESRWIVHGLAFFNSAEADELAFQYLNELERQDYLDARAAANEIR